MFVQFLLVLLLRESHGKYGNRYQWHHLGFISLKNVSRCCRRSALKPRTRIFRVTMVSHDGRCGDISRLDFFTYVRTLIRRVCMYGTIRGIFTTRTVRTTSSTSLVIIELVVELRNIPGDETVRKINKSMGVLG